MKAHEFAYYSIRALAIIFVIGIHSLGLVNDALPSEVSFGQARVINALMGIVYSGVPLFVMLSGALLLGKIEPMRIFFKERMSCWVITYHSIENFYKVIGK